MQKFLAGDVLSVDPRQYHDAEAPKTQNPEFDD